MGGVSTISLPEYQPLDAKMLENLLVSYLFMAENSSIWKKNISFCYHGPNCCVPEFALQSWDVINNEYPYFTSGQNDFGS